MLLLVLDPAVRQKTQRVTLTALVLVFFATLGLAWRELSEKDRMIETLGRDCTNRSVNQSAKGIR